MNTNQHKFIEFVVENLLALNEAYGKAEVEKLVNKFKTQADALGIKGANGDLTEDEIKTIINGFDQIRSTAASSIPTEKRDINRWNIRDLIRFVFEKIDLGSEEKEEEEDKTPDVVYDDSNYIIWNGSKEGNCIKYGKGERWCITKGSFGSYRYSQQRGYPVFYLVKNKNLPESNALSFVAIQVRDKPENQRYVFTNRKNSPYESSEMNWDQLTSAIPWLTDIPDVKNKLKYIGVSNIEKKQKNWGSYSGLNEDQFDVLSFNEKKAYLTARKESSNLIDGESHSFFVKNILPEYPELKKWIADFPFEFGFKDLIENFDEFTPAQQKSIAIKVNNVEHGGNDISISSSSLKEIGVKNVIKLLELNPKAFPPQNNRYVGLVKIDGDNYIIHIDVTNDNSLNIEYFTPTGFKEFKLNSYSEDALFNHPYVKNLPFEAVAKTIQSNNLSTKKVGGLLYKIQNPKEGEDNGGLNITDINGKKVLFDLNGIKPTVYDITGNKLSKIDTNSEGNEEVKAKFKQLISTNDNLKVAIGRNIISSPQASFKIYTPSEIYSIFEDAPKEIYDQIISERDYKTFPLFLENNTTVYFTRGILNSTEGKDRYWKESDISNFITAVKKTNYKFDDNAISQMMNDQGRYMNNQQNLRLLLQNPEFQSIVAQGNTYRYVVINNEIYRYNPNNLSDSNMFSQASGRWIRGRVRPQDIGQQPTAQPTAAAGRRGRPAGATQAQQATPTTPTTTGSRIDNTFSTANLTAGFNSLPLGARRRLLQNGATLVDVRGDRGSSGRQNQLGTSGRVTAAYSIDSGGQQPTKVYFITMASGAVIASINIQPGNYNYIVTANRAFVVNNPRQLMAALQANNINEGMKSFIVKNYLSLNPHQIDEVKAMLKNHTSNKKN